MKTLADLVVDFKAEHPDVEKSTQFDALTVANPLDLLTKSGKKAYFKWAGSRAEKAHRGQSFDVRGEQKSWAELSDTQQLKFAVMEALEEMTEVRIRDVAYSIGLNHVQSNDISVLCDNLLRRYPDYRLIMMLDHPNAGSSAFQNATLTCCEYDNENR